MSALDAMDGVDVVTVVVTPAADHGVVPAPILRATMTGSSPPSASAMDAAVAAYIQCPLTNDMHVRSRSLLAVVVLVVGLLISVPAWNGRALADGDPASDVLAETPVFFPADGSIPAAQESQLLELVRAAQRRGYPIRVALVAKQDDLGSVAALWNQPPRYYAGFLATELSLVFRGTVLVVRPDGYGIDVDAGEPDQRARTLAAAEPLVHLPPPGAGGAALAQSAIAAVLRVTGAAGVHLTVPRATATATPAGGAGGVDLAAVVALGLGVAALAGAWAASLRIRPLRRVTETPSSRDGV